MHMTLAIALLLGAAAISPAGTSWVDLTYDMSSETLYWPTGQGFDWGKVSWGKNPEGLWYAAGKYCTVEHIGTHVDAPIHFCETGISVEQLPLERLIGKAAVIDVRPQCKDSIDYRLTVEDIKADEARNGRIEPGSVVLMLTGWGERWPNWERYYGTPTPKDTATLHFPSFSVEAAGFLVEERQAVAVGLDNASIDYGQSKTFEVHRYVNAKGVYGIENVANLEKLPPRGAEIWVLPIRIKGGSGAPARIVARLP
ncbi:MAG: cyclase family protein [Acidobacteriota bacterium]